MAVVNDAAQQKTTALLAQLWQKNLPLLEERLAVLRNTKAQLDSDSLDPELRTEAIAIAHKMAGSLGMFGLPQATEAARRLEVLLGEAAPKASQFDQYLNDLEEAIRQKNVVT